MDEEKVKSPISTVDTNDENKLKTLVLKLVKNHCVELDDGDKCGCLENYC